MELEDLKLFLRVDGNDEDTLIGGIQLAVEGYFANAGIVKDYTNPLYTQGVKLLSKHWYDNRELYVELKTTKVSFSLDSIIFSLKYNQPAPVVV